MPITVSDLVSRIRRVGLDAEPDSDYYNDLIDIVPAIDSAVKWTISVVDAARAQNKRTNEILKELTVANVYTTNILSRVTIEGGVWTIDSVFPLPITYTIPNVTPPAPPADTLVSYQNTNLAHKEGWYQAGRLTSEEWGVNVFNPLEKGNIIQVDGVDMTTLTTTKKNIDFGFLDTYNYQSASSVVTNNALAQIEIRPFIPQMKVSIFFTKIPNTLTATNDTIPFNQNMFNFIYDKALQFISRSQGDGTNLWSVTNDDIAKLFASVSK